MSDYERMRDKQNRIEAALDDRSQYEAHVPFPRTAPHPDTLRCEHLEAALERIAAGHPDGGPWCGGAEKIAREALGDTPRKDLADRIETALDSMDPFAPDTPNLNAWPQPNARRAFAEWLAARV
jgi:hypothetical protein